MPPEVEVEDLSRSAFRVGEWLVEPSLNRVTRGDTTIQLELKVMDVLVCLAGRAGELVTRRDLTDTVWATEFISDNTVSHAVAELRAALGDDARQPSYIETIHRRGYRLIAPVETVASEDLGPSTVARFSSPARSEPAVDESSPYPGLAAFTEEDAENFFGREVEVARMWRKLTSRRLLAVIGPSGVGKSSFLRAGVIPAKPEGWGAIVCQPGEGPFGSLARALVPQFGADTDAVTRLVGIRDSAEMVAIVSRWRERHQRALLVVDQFEELFTQNPPEVQADFAGLLRKLVDDADVHVVLAMRDDFLYRCQALEPLGAILDGLFALEQPDSESLRRALVEPARRQGYAFEDDELPQEMVAEVEGERGALPMLAFAVARLWEKRNRERRLLTRQAYAEIGKVGGALAKHAEATLTALGDEKLPIVRELFRNLLTAEGTRAVREWDELLSVFCDSSDESQAVLRSLIDARLLTSYEVREDDREPTRRLEIIHESLLANWPRLVRWQTQDADAAQLRDQLRQAARTWEDHERTDDLLWTGSAYREFTVWRERYPGGLTEIEEAFSVAMIAHARRQKRRRRVAVSAALVIAVAVAAVFGTLWRRSVKEARRAEAANLLSLAQLELESYPSAALAYATASIELSDSPDARRLALDALWSGPTAFVVNEEPSWEMEFSPDGQWIVQATDSRPFRLHVIGADGTDEEMEDVHDSRIDVRMGSDSEIFATIPWGGTVEPWALWSLQEKRLLAKGRSGFPDNLWGVYYDLRRRRAALIVKDDDRFFIDALGFDGTSERLGSIPFDLDAMAMCSVAPHGEWFALSNGHDVYVIEIGDHSLSEPQHLDHVEGPVADIECDPLGRFIAARDEDGLIRLWDLNGESLPRVIQGPLGVTRTRITADGSLLTAEKSEKGEVESWIWTLATEVPTFVRHINLGREGGPAGWTLNPVDRQIISSLNPDSKVRLWPMGAPADASPVIMQRGDSGVLFRLAVHPNGGWLATSGSDGVALWPVARPFPIVLNGYGGRVGNLTFGPHGEWLAASEMSSNPGIVRIWDLVDDVLPPSRLLYEGGLYAYGVAASPDGNRILLGAHSETAKLLSLDGEAPVDLPGVVGAAWGVAISPDGRLAAASGVAEDLKTRVIRVWDLASLEQVAVMDRAKFPFFLRFTKDGRVLSGIPSGLLIWDPERGESEILFEGEGQVARIATASSDSHTVLLQVIENLGAPSRGRAVAADLSTGATTPLVSHGDVVTAVATDADGMVAVSGDENGVIRVGPITGEEPHILLGNRNEVWDLAIDPRGRWIASASGTEVRLWPMPDLSKPPLHTLPHDELIAKLKSLTNLRVVRDEASSTGWKVEIGPFPGWADVPEW